MEVPIRTMILKAINRNNKNEKNYKLNKNNVYLKLQRSYLFLFYGELALFFFVPVF